MPEEPIPHTWTAAFGHACGWLLRRIVNGLAASGISPNALTLIGLFINLAATLLYALATPVNHSMMFGLAGAVIIGAGLFDMVDGRVARQTNQVTPFGGFFDSVIDRYSDVVLFLGILIFYARFGTVLYVVLTAYVMAASLMVSYTRARAESIIPICKVGFMERPERIVLLILGSLFDFLGVMPPALWILAVLSTITIVNRITYTWQQTKQVSR
jgi:CDP-diacylglycerol--glycerol-3-phosphate 3-phosphatidyltransferase